MNFKSIQRLIGIVLILAGLLAILQAFDILPGSAWDIVWAGLFLVGSAIFLYTFLQNRNQWWALIPGFTLLGLSIIIVISFAFPSISYLSGFIFLGAIGLSFLLIYLRDRAFWWALIPAGTLITLGVVSIVDRFFQDDISGSVFFGGMGLTFIMLYILPTKDNLSWALIPGLVLIGLGAVVSLSVNTISNMIFPAIIIAAGIIILIKSILNK